MIAGADAPVERILAESNMSPPKRVPVPSGTPISPANLPAGASQ
jgi:hypothetical protein